MLSPSMLVRSTLPRLVSVAMSAAVALALFSDGTGLASAQNDKPQSAKPSEKAGESSDVARGKYIVESVAVCGQCHTPRDSQGNLDRSRWLQGGPVPYLSAKPESDWPINAPRIGGTPPAPDPDLVKLLTTGIWTDGNRLRLPMPQFRMNVSDAQAIVAYLKSLTPTPQP
jgi:mono/diheme cytochrome c family protein